MTDIKFITAADLEQLSKLCDEATPVARGEGDAHECPICHNYYSPHPEMDDEIAPCDSCAHNVMDTLREAMPRLINEIHALRVQRAEALMDIEDLQIKINRLDDICARLAEARHRGYTTK